MVQLCSRCGGGGTGDRPVTCTMVEGGPCAACIESASIYHQIRQLEEEIAELKAKRRMLATTMNANHDPFIHKLPPEIGSRIFYLCMPSVESPIWVPWKPQKKGWKMPLKLGAVCRKWRQLAWATPNLWVALSLEIKPSTSLSLAKLLPDLLREWLGRSGLLPLTISFDHAGYSEIPFGTSFDFYLTRAEEIRVKTLKAATDLVIEVIDLYWGRLENLDLELVADIHERISGSMQPNKITRLSLAVLNGNRLPTQKFITESKPNPKHLTLVEFPPTSIDIGWDNVTHAMLGQLYFNEWVEVLQRAPALEYCCIYGWPEDCWDDPTIDFDTAMVHPRLRSLKSDDNAESLLHVINVPSLEEWTHDMANKNDCAWMISLLDRSNCFLKVLNLERSLPKDLCALLQATPLLERLCFVSERKFGDAAILDDMVTRMSRTTLDSGVSSVEGAASGSFLPHLRFLDCGASDDIISPFTWDLIPQLYYQGHRWSLTLKSWAHESHISDETGLQLLQLVEEGVDLQICDLETRGDFLRKFRKRMKGDDR
jgi:hypothetical protein